MKIITRKAYICKTCEGVYADSPVTECDCTGGVKNNFWIGVIEYTIPGDESEATV